MTTLHLKSTPRIKAKEPVRIFEIESEWTRA